MSARRVEGLDAAQRATAYRYAADMLKAAQEDEVDREALVLAATQLATSEGHTHLAASFRRVMRMTARPLPAVPAPWRERLASRDERAAG